MSTPILSSLATRLLGAATLSLVLAVQPARAQGASEASAVSMLPVAVSVTAPALLLGGSAALSVVAVEAASDGVVWVLERASDGARTSVKVAGGVSMAVGTAVTVSAFSAGWVLSAAGRAVAFVPNEVGRTLLHNERVTR